MTEIKYVRDAQKQRYIFVRIEKLSSHCAMKDAILGYTGFVGSHLRENMSPDNTEYFNSENIKDVKGREFRSVYCACTPAIKWIANADPEGDAEEIDALKDTIASIKCQRFVHISTIDVHSPEVLDQVEDDVTPSRTTYGKNRFFLEIFLRKHFGDKLLIARLPALFGVGLKKNYMYDLMNGNQLEKINVNSSFQWYSLAWLWEDLIFAQEDGRKIVNLYTESVETRDIVRTFFPHLEDSLTVDIRVFYSQSSKYGGRSAQEVFQAMADYLALEEMKTKIIPRTVISNMAWKTEHDEHAAFLMHRYGIKRLEILPTKFAPWEEVFHSNLEKQLETFRRYDISVYSVQSIFHGVEGGFGDDNIEEHLRKVVKFSEKIGAEVIVVGSPTMRGKNCDKKALGDLLHNIQGETRVKICLEPNSSAYKCCVGRNLDECRDVRGGRKFSLNYDTGNAYMEKDRLPERVDGIGHVQISNALLSPMKKTDYRRLVDTGVCRAIGELLSNHDSVNVSLEVSMHDNVKLLGEQIRRFVGFFVKYHM